MCWFSPCITGCCWGWRFSAEPEIFNHQVKQMVAMIKSSHLNIMHSTQKMKDKVISPQC